MNKRILISGLLLAASSQAIAKDITRELVESPDASGAYSEFGIALGAYRLPLVGLNDKSIAESDDTFGTLAISFEGRFQYRDFFIEAVQDSFSNFTLGYSVYDDERGNLEVIGTNLFGDLERDDVEGLETIEDRGADFSLGFRSSHYFGDNIVQLELVGDVSGAHNGFVGAVNVGRQKQILNWNLHGLIGVRYFSDHVIDHLFGVSAEEATADFPEYEADAGVMPSIQIGASLPLSENWLFKTKATYSPLPDSVSDSPLAQGDSIAGAEVGFAYVFGGK